ncbi:hypothetical protein SAMN05660668_00671 [Pseudobutyrivibrio sp. AR14]|nr:hypothetical protein SAMN05660668_00671 [Pseudobutyrivibrio sp. AR14]
MNMNLQDILNMESKEISLSFEKTRLEGKGTPQEVADRSEGYVRDFFRKYFPFPNRIVKGNIVDTRGIRSNSIDCIILNPSHPYTVDSKNNSASIILADGVDFAIEVKSKLKSKSEIERTLEQIRSVKKLRRLRNGIIFPNRVKAEEIECANTIPAIIFVDETYKNLLSLISKIADYYIQNKVPYIEQFDLLLVNNRVLIYNYRPDMYISWSDERAIVFYEGGEKCLASMLLYMNRMPRCIPEISVNIMSLYLKDANPKQLTGFKDVNKKLQEANV